MGISLCNHGRRNPNYPLGAVKLWLFFQENNKYNPDIQIRFITREDGQLAISVFNPLEGPVYWTESLELQCSQKDES